MGAVLKKLTAENCVCCLCIDVCLKHCIWVDFADFEKGCARYMTEFDGPEVTLCG